MKTFTIILFLIIPFIVWCQNPKVYIEPQEYEGWAIENIEKFDNGWDVVSTIEESNVILKLTISKALVSATGNLEILNSRNNKVLYTSPSVKGYNWVTSGYSPVNDAIKKLIKNLHKNFNKSLINTNEFGHDKVNIEDKYDKLIKLKELLNLGIITSEEFEKEKKKILENE